MTTTMTMTPIDPEKTRLRSSSPSPMDYRFTAVAAAPDSTTAGNSRNSDLVTGLAYHPIEVGTTNLQHPLGRDPSPGAGYPNGGLSISDRPRFPEPFQQAASMDVDIDYKFHEEYSKLDGDDLRAQYDVARGEQHTTPEHLQTNVHPMYRGVLNQSKSEQKKKRRNCTLKCVIILLFVTNLISLVLGAFVLANTLNVGSITGKPQAITENSVEFLEVRINAIMSNFSAFKDMHTEMFTSINLELQQVKQNCSSNDVTTTSSSLPPNTASPTNEEPATPPNLTTGTATPPNLTLTTSTPLPSSTAPPSRLAFISIYENCTTSRELVCGVSRASLVGGATPGFTSCSTTSISLDNPSEEQITDIFCTVSQEQFMPVTSTLLHQNGAFSCYCHAIEITNRAQNQLRDFDCEMYVTRCPTEVRLPAN